jgi:hypothetical protein
MKTASFLLFCRPTYNILGLNQSEDTLFEMLDEFSPDFQLLQEHRQVKENVCGL